ncbi:MAG: TonB-dependent siderophore receptor [Ferrovibrio sp.]|uniref:TonB-dependent siderophore receptor n=1 Tax=Ferrovibrio sp. TaxID=1917215 RepID=UPI00391C935F
MRFTEITGLQLFADANLTRALRSSAVTGSLTPEAALQRLLDGTGLTYRFTNPTTVTLLEAPKAGSATVLPVIGVEGRSGTPETAWGPVQGYMARRSATATKTDTPIMETPAAVQVIPRQVIEDQRALSLKDVYENVSSVQQAGNTLNAQTEVLPIIRGFESPTLLRNGLRSTNVGAVDLANVERVEVLKGPASILYGSLQPGGIVSYVTKRPQATESHTLEQDVGSYNLFRTAVDSTGPLSQDGALSYRVNLARTDSDSFRDNIDLQRSSLAPSFLWQGDRTELLLDFSYMHERQPYDIGVPLTADGKPMVSSNVFLGDPDLDGRTLDDYVASYQLSHELSSVWSLRHQFQVHRAEAKNESLRPRGIAGTAANPQLQLRYQNEDRRDDEVQLVLDATAKFATGSIEHTLLLGGDAVRQDSDFRRFRQNIANVAISDSTVVNYTPPVNQTKQVISGATDWAGLYVQDQLSLLEDGRLKLLLGGRYDIVHQESTTDSVTARDVHDRAFTGRAGLLYQFTRQHAGYVSVSQSFLPQSTGTLDRSGAPLDPEEGLQYETGIKSSFFNERLTATAAIFEIEKSNVAVSDQAWLDATGQSASIPGVSQRSRGFEFDLIGDLTPQLRIIANYSFTDTETLENPNDASVVGKPLGGVPEHKARLWLTYEFEEGLRLGGLGFGGGARYVGSNTAQFANTIQLDPYTVFDAAVWYRWKNLKAGLNVYNLFDHDYIARASDRSIAHPGAPLTVVGSLSITF